jgi:hypothetical protein
MGQLLTTFFHGYKRSEIIACVQFCLGTSSHEETDVTVLFIVYDQAVMLIQVAALRGGAYCYISPINTNHGAWLIVVVSLYYCV